MSLSSALYFADPSELLIVDQPVSYDAPVPSRLSKALLVDTPAGFSISSWIEVQPLVLVGVAEPQLSILDKKWRGRGQHWSSCWSWKFPAILHYGSHDAAGGDMRGSEVSSAASVWDRLKLLGAGILVMAY